MALPARIAIATRNPGKIREILTVCADWSVAWVTDDAFAWPTVEETAVTYLENALLKAHAAAVAAGIPAIADDSGIEVDALGGDPGVRSARFAGPDATDADNLSLLIARVRDVPRARRTARYRCVAACVWPDGREVWAEATCEGTLIVEPRGSGGFGYDPIFLPDDERAAGRHRTMAELDPEEKDRISHRGRALRRLRHRLVDGDGASPA